MDAAEIPQSSRLSPFDLQSFFNFAAYASDDPEASNTSNESSNVGNPGMIVSSSSIGTGPLRQYANAPDSGNAAPPPAPPPLLQQTPGTFSLLGRDSSVAECRIEHRHTETFLHSSRRAFHPSHHTFQFDHPQPRLPIAAARPVANVGKRKRNEQARPQAPAMEGPTALAAQAHTAALPPPPALPSSPPVRSNTPPAVMSPQHDPQRKHLPLTTMPPELDQTPAKVQPVMAHGSNPSWPDTPAHVTDHGMLSNIRGANGQDTLALDDDLLNNAAMSPHAAKTLNQLPLQLVEDAVFGEDEGPGTPFRFEQSPVEEEFAEHEAYAMLRFPDSHALITSRNLVITRDDVYFRRFRRQQLQQRKQRRRAQIDLIEYGKEPSRKSEDGLDNNASLGDGEQLEGRPARGLLSNFSEQGGPVAYAPSDDEDLEEYEANRARKRQRKNNNSSTSNSVAPADLHLFHSEALDAGEQMGVSNYITEDGTEYDPREWAALPVHTAHPDDISRISREHLIFSYDGLNERWVLHVVGNGAVVNGVPYMKGTRDIVLHHDDEIFISTVAMRFALPAGLDRSSDGVESIDAVLESVEAASEMHTSPIRRLADAFGAEDSNEEDDENDEDAAPQSTPKKPKLVKLKLKNPNAKSKDQKKPTSKDEAAKGKGKGKPQNQQKDQSRAGSKAKPKEKSDGKDELKESVKPEKGKKPKAAAPDVVTASKSEGDKTTIPTAPDDNAQAKPTQASPPVAPLNLDPGSVLAGLEPEQMPEKRKGPGRPPKNGVLSKRDESGVKRKRKEYERQGMEPPELNILLQEVRAEQRQKDAMNKALARGEPAPDVALPSVETETKPEGEAGSRIIPREPQGLDGEGAASGERRASSPKPARRPKSPSPIPPEASYTEEELKKPNMTYIYIINEILETIEGGQADLQTIYDKIQKRWPFYKYKVSSVGWQSSVRHNLLSCERFKEAGKSGKGKMWTINTEHPLDNKKRKNSPPPRQPPVATNGYQYGQSGYGQYNQPPYNPSGPYASPYSGGPNGHYPPPHHGGAPRPPSQQPRQDNYGAFGGIVQDILAFKSAWVEVHKHDPVKYASLVQIFDRGTTYYSDIYHKSGQDPGPPVNAEEEPFKTLKAIFEKHNDIFNNATANAPAAAVPPNTAPDPNGAVPSAPPLQQSQARTQVALSNLPSGPPQFAGSAVPQPSSNGSLSTGVHANGVVSATGIQQGPSAHSHASVQQQDSNAIATRERAVEAQQGPVQAKLPAPPPGPYGNQMLGTGVLQPQPQQSTFQQHTFTAASNSASIAGATPAAAPVGGSLASASTPVAVVVGASNNQADPAPSPRPVVDNTTSLASSAPRAVPGLPTEHNTSGVAPSYGTPKAPTPEALSRPPSAGTGVKRAAEDEVNPVNEADARDAKRQRTS